MSRLCDLSRRRRTHRPPLLAGVALITVVGCAPELDGVAPSALSPSASSATPVGAPPGAQPPGSGLTPGAPAPTVTGPPGTTNPADTASASVTASPSGTGTSGDPATTPTTTPGAGGAPPVVVEDPVDTAILDATPVTRLRLLTQLEYRNSVARLLQGTETATLALPSDSHVKSFTTVGGSLATVNQVAGEQYETASQALTREVFSDPARWQALVGCEPQADLADACVETFVRSFGRRAFRRDLTDEEALQWVEVARNGATLSGDAATGLATATSGILQSPNFLYRIEYAVPDLELGRIRFDGASMATRLAFLLTGATPDDWLLDAALAGELDGADGVRVAAQRLIDEGTSVEHISDFFIELTELWQVLEMERPPELFPGVDELRPSLLEETRLWLSEVVLAPQADVRTFFDSPTTFVDGTLAEFYGVSLPGGGPADGFQEVSLDPSTGRAGILGKAGFVFAHSSPDSTNPTKRGKFIIEQFRCLEVPPVPADLMVSVPKAEEGEAVTTRELFEERHRVDATCVTCHSLMDPFGFALEHFDAIGRYRETEDGLPINAASEFQGVTFDGAAELGTVLRNYEDTAACFVEHLYRYANGTPDTEADMALIEELAVLLSERSYVWRDLLVDFAASDAFISLEPTAGIPSAGQE